MSSSAPGASILPATATAIATAPRAALWLWLGAWLGAMVFFGALARVAFHVIPDSAVAGDLVASMLGPLLGIGAVSGLGLSALAIRLGRGRFTIVVPLVLTAACLLNQFGVSPAVAEIRLDDPGLSPELAARFAALHKLSVWLFVGTGIGLVALAVAHGLAEARGTRPKPV